MYLGNWRDEQDLYNLHSDWVEKVEVVIKRKHAFFIGKSPREIMDFVQHQISNAEAYDTEMDVDRSIFKTSCSEMDDFLVVCYAITEKELCFLAQRRIPSGEERYPGDTEEIQKAIVTHDEYRAVVTAFGLALNKVQ